MGKHIDYDQKMGKHIEHFIWIRFQQLHIIHPLLRYSRARTRVFIAKWVFHLASFSFILKSIVLQFFKKWLERQKQDMRKWSEAVLGEVQTGC